MWILTPAEWNRMRHDSSKRDKVLKVSRRCMALLGSATYKGLEGFRLVGEVMSETEDDDPDISLDALQARLKKQKERNANVRAALLEPEEATIRHVMDLVHLDMNTSRPVVGRSGFKAQKIRLIECIDLTQRQKKVASDDEGIKMCTHEPLQSIFQKEKYINYLVLGSEETGTANEMA